MTHSEHVPQHPDKQSSREMLDLSDAIDMSQWQMMQDHFSEVIGIALRTVDTEGKPITQPSRPTRLCTEVVADSLSGLARCAAGLTPFLAGAPQPKCLPSFVISRETGRDIECFSCHVGLTNFVIPISVNRDIQLGSLIAGPVILGTREDAKQYTGVAVELGISVEELVDALREIKLFSYSGIESVMQLLKDVTHYITQLGYQRLKLKEILPSAPKVGLAVNAFYQDKLFGTLLEAASLAMDAEIASIMLINPTTGELYIKLAKGLRQDIIEKTKVRLGEGLAGIAAKEKRSLFISDDVQDRRIRERLNRPELTSAMIVPIKPEGAKDVYGVINVGTCRKEHAMDRTKAALLEQLVNLAGVALTRLGPA